MSIASARGWTQLGEGAKSFGRAIMENASTERGKKREEWEQSQAIARDQKTELFRNATLKLQQDKAAADQAREELLGGIVTGPDSPGYEATPLATAATAASLPSLPGVSGRSIINEVTRPGAKRYDPNADPDNIRNREEDARELERDSKGHAAALQLQGAQDAAANWRLQQELSAARSEGEKTRAAAAERTRRGPTSLRSATDSIKNREREVSGKAAEMLEGGATRESVTQYLAIAYPEVPEGIRSGLIAETLTGRRGEARDDLTVQTRRGGGGVAPMRVGSRTISPIGGAPTAPAPSAAPVSGEIAEARSIIKDWPAATRRGRLADAGYSEAEINAILGGG